MLTLDLARLSARGSLETDFHIDPWDPFWADTGLTPVEPLEGRVRAVYATTGDILVTGRLAGRMGSECRRCVEGLEIPVRTEFRVLFTTGDEGEQDDGDGSVRALDPGAHEIDLTEALREEVILAAPRFVVCSEECRGLCAHCGANLNEEECDCERSEEDPRWAPLRALKRE